EVVVDRRAVRKQRQLGVLDAQPGDDRIAFRDRNAEADGGTQCLRRILRHRQGRRIDVLLINLERARDAVDGPIRLGERERNRLVDLAGVDRRDQRVAAAEDVLLRYRTAQDDAVRGGITDTGGDAAGGFFRYRHFDIGLVRRAWNGWRFDVHV